MSQCLIKQIFKLIKRYTGVLQFSDSFEIAC